MFWELPKVEEALNALCKKWFVNDCRAYIKETLNFSTDTENISSLSSIPMTEYCVPSTGKTPGVELGFVEKMIEI